MRGGVRWQKQLEKCWIWQSLERRRWLMQKHWKEKGSMNGWQWEQQRRNWQEFEENVGMRQAFSDRSTSRQCRDIKKDLRGSSSRNKVRMKQGRRKKCCSSTLQHMIFVWQKLIHPRMKFEFYRICFKTITGCAFFTSCVNQILIER